MEAREFPEKGVTVIKVPSTLSAGQMAEANEFKEFCLKLLDKGARRVLIDLHGVAMLPSSVLGNIIIIHKRICENKGKMVLFGAGGYVKKAFDVTRLDKMIKVCDTEEQAFELVCQNGE